MAFRYSKRVGGSKGLGLNLSGSGVSSSYRSKYGSIGTKGFSIRTGIPGLTFRNSWGRGKDKGATALIFLFIIVAVFLFYVSAVLLYNFIRLLWWLCVEAYHLTLRTYYKWKERREMKQNLRISDTEKNSR